MSIRKPMFALLAALGLGLGGCMQATLEPASETSMKPRDKELLANPPYAKASIPEQYQRHIVTYHRREAAGTIVIDSDARYLYYVLPGGRAIRYGVTVAELDADFGDPSADRGAAELRLRWTGKSVGRARDVCV